MNEYNPHKLLAAKLESHFKCYIKLEGLLVTILILK